MTKKKWIMVIGIGAVLLVGGGYGLTQYQTHVKAEEQQQAFQDKQDQLAEMVNSYKKEAEALYLNSKKELLAKGITAQKVASLESQLHQLEGKKTRVTTAEELNTAIVDTAYASKMVGLRDQVNKLLDDKGVLVEKANVSETEKQAIAIKKAKPIFYAQQNKIIQEAKQQQAQITKANQAVDTLFTDISRKKVNPKVTRAQFQTALAEKNKVKQATAKQALIQDLNRVENDLKMREQQRQVEEAKIKEEEMMVPQTNSTPSTEKSSSQAPTNRKSATKSYSGSSSSPTSGGTSSDSSYTAPHSSSQRSTASSAGKTSSSTSNSGKSNDSGNHNNANSSANKDSSHGGRINENGEELTDTKENANGGEDHYWGWD